MRLAARVDDMSVDDVVDRYNFAVRRERAR